VDIKPVPEIDGAVLFAPSLADAVEVLAGR